MLTGGSVEVEQGTDHLSIVLVEAARGAPINRIIELERGAEQAVGSVRVFDTLN